MTARQKHTVGKASAELNRRIAELALRNMNAPEIAEALGVGINVVNNRVGRMRTLGLLPRPSVCRKGPSTKSRQARLSYHFKHKLGTMTSVVESLSEQEIVWLYTSTPAGETLAEFISRMIKDACERGTMHTVAASLSESEAAWMSSSVPEGMMLAEFLAALVRDAYHEEVEDDRQG